MRPMSLLSFAAVAAFAVSCSPRGSVCQKEFDCQKELKVVFEDDYVQVCSATADGASKALQANAEKQCKDLDTAENVLAACELTLDCAKLAAERSDPDSTDCKDQRKGVADAVQATIDEGGCTGIGAADAGEGEGEGE